MSGLFLPSAYGSASIQPIPTHNHSQVQYTH